MKAPTACFARLCVFPDAWNQDCVGALECHDLTAEAADRSPVSSLHLKATDTLDWAYSDLRQMAEVLTTKGD